MINLSGFSDEKPWVPSHALVKPRQDLEPKPWATSLLPPDQASFAFDLQGALSLQHERPRGRGASPVP